MQTFNGEEGMLINREAMIEITHHEGIDQLKLRQQNREQSERMHGAQRFSGVRLNEHVLQISPTLRAGGRQIGERWQNLLNAALGGHCGLEAVMRCKAENSEKKVGIAECGRLLQQDQAVNHGKIGVREPRPEILKRAIK